MSDDVNIRVRGWSNYNACLSFSVVLMRWSNLEHDVRVVFLGRTRFFLESLLFSNVNQGAGEIFQRSIVFIGDSYDGEALSIQTPSNNQPL